MAGLKHRNSSALPLQLGQPPSLTLCPWMTLPSHQTHWEARPRSPTTLHVRVTSASTARAPYTCHSSPHAVELLVYILPSDWKLNKGGENVPLIFRPQRLAHRNHGNKYLPHSARALLLIPRTSAQVTEGGYAPAHLPCAVRFFFQPTPIYWSLLWGLQ